MNREKKYKHPHFAISQAQNSGRCRIYSQKSQDALKMGVKDDTELTSQKARKKNAEKHAPSAHFVPAFGKLYEFTYCMLISMR
jgi:hypothetical protein